MSIFDSELLNEYTKEYVFLNKAIVQDKVGGYKTIWTPGAKFDAIVTENNSTEALVASIENKTTFYGVKVERAVPLEYHTVFKRIEDGKTFRIRNADSMTTPSFSEMNMKQLEAEEYTPPEE